MSLGNPIAASPSAWNESPRFSPFASILVYALVLAALCRLAQLGPSTPSFRPVALKQAPAATSAQAGRCHCALQATALYLYLALLAAGSAPTGTLCKCVPSAKLRRCHPLPPCFSAFFSPTLPLDVFFLFPSLDPS